MPSLKALGAYIDAAGIAEDRKGWLFRRAQRQHPLRSVYEPAGRVAHDPAARVIYSFKGRGKRAQR